MSPNNKKKLLILRKKLDVIDKPESVSLVKPPTIIILETSINMVINQ